MAVGVNWRELRNEVCGSGRHCDTGKSMGGRVQKDVVDDRENGGFFQAIMAINKQKTGAY